MNILQFLYQSGRANRQRPCSRKSGVCAKLFAIAAICFAVASVLGFITKLFPIDLMFGGIAFLYSCLAVKFYNSSRNF